MARTNISPDTRFQDTVLETDLMTPTSTAGTPATGTYYSSVTNRKSITDLRKDLKPRMGIERVMIQQLVVIQDEFGSNGEPVYGLVNDSENQVRFVGAWTAGVSAYGVYASSGANTTDFMEITFYGTGLNVLVTANSAGYNIVSSVDGGSDSANLMSASYSSIVQARNYSANQILNAAVGLSAGVHTVRIRNNTASTGTLIHGFEILNDSSSVTINPGNAQVLGKKLNLSAQQAIAYNTTFESGTLGSRGGRVVSYLKSNGSIGRAVQPVDAAQANLTSASHANEDIARRYFWREFGAGRSDDFSNAPSTGSPTNLTFTLDDGVTTLMGSGVGKNFINGVDVITPVTAGSSFLTFTFVGSGLDITYSHDALSGTSSVWTVTVDGTSIGTIQPTLAYRNRLSIVSGLPYGTHTVKLAITTLNANRINLESLIVYQPKKPTLPSGAVELADYNVLADYSATTTATVGSTSTGIVRKFSASRETVYVGTFSGVSVDVNNFESGLNVNTTTSGSYFQYTFFGTGVEWRTQVGAVTYNATITVTNVATGATLNLSSYTTNLRQSSTGLSFTASTGVLSGTATNGFARLQITGLPLGTYTFKIVQNQSGTGQFYSDCLDIVTPIHSNKSNLYFDLQNTLTVGSQGLSDSRKMSPIENSIPTKSVVQAIGVASGPTSSSTSLVPMPDMSVMHSNKTGKIRISFNANITIPTNTAGFKIYVDGMAISPETDVNNATNLPISISGFTYNVSPGAHKIEIYWAVSTGTVTAVNNYRSLIVEEI